MASLSRPKHGGEIRLLSAPGFTWELFCVAVVGLSALGASAAAVTEIVNNRDPGLPLVLTAIALLLLTLKLTPVLANRYRERQRSALRTAEALMKDDPRPPVLYLRSFKDDETIARAIAFYSIEQEMKVVFFEIGPFIAMAEPDKQEPQDPGAARMRLPKDSWREQVGAEMSRAALVIMRIGDTDGFWWEMREAPKRVNAERLVLLIPSEDKKLYEEFRLKAGEVLPHPLPPYEPSKRPFGGEGGIVYFEADWTPHLRKFETVWLRQTFWNLFSAVLKIAMKPVYEQLGIEWTKPPVQAAQVLYMSVLLLLSLFALYLIYAMAHNFLGII